MNGACATNGRPEAPSFYDVNKAIEKPDIAGSFQRGQAEGQRLRLERERHQAEMAVLAAQTEALRSQTRAAKNQSLDPPTRSAENGTFRALANQCEVYVSIVDGTTEKYSKDDIDKKMIEAGRCIGYLDGFVEGYSAGSSDIAPKNCKPASVSIDTLARVVVGAAVEIPDLTKNLSVAAVTGLLAAKYPCN